jgi:hypothetical protein
MRILFVGLSDPNGWMYEYSKLINKYTNIVSNCILYKDVAGYGADIVLKTNKRTTKDIMGVEDKLDLIHAFAKETDIFIFNGCDIQTDGFKYGRIDWNKYIKGKIVYLFVGDMINNPEQLFVKMVGIKTITNQPRIYHDYTNSRGLGLSLVQPILDFDPIYVLPKKNNKLNSFLYRDEAGIKDSKNLETFFMIFSFIFNEFENIDYVSMKGETYQTVIQHLSSFDYSFDMMYPVGIYSRASIEAVYSGMINFISMPKPYSELFMDSIDSQDFCFDSVNNEKELYEKVKFYILNENERIIRQGKIREWTNKHLISNKIYQIVNLL